MEIKLYEIVVSGAVALAAPSLSYYITKRHELRVAQHNLKLSQYQEFLEALANIVGCLDTDIR